MKPATEGIAAQGTQTAPGCGVAAGTITVSAVAARHAITHGGARRRNTARPAATHPRQARRSRRRRMRAADTRKHRPNRSETIIRHRTGPHQTPQRRRNLRRIRESHHLTGRCRRTHQLRHPLTQRRHEQTAVSQRLIDGVLERARSLQCLPELRVLRAYQLLRVVLAQSQRRTLAQMQANPAVRFLRATAAELTGAGEEHPTARHEFVQHVRLVAGHARRKNQRLQRGSRYAHTRQLVDGGEQILRGGGRVFGAVFHVVLCRWVERRRVRGLCAEGCHPLTHYRGGAAGGHECTVGARLRQGLRNPHR